MSVKTEQNDCEGVGTNSYDIANSTVMMSSVTSHRARTDCLEMFKNK